MATLSLISAIISHSFVLRARSWKIKSPIRAILAITHFSQKQHKNVLAKPWITKGIRKSIKVKNKLLSTGDRNLYKFYRNKILTLTRARKKVYFHNYFQENLNNMKKTWEGVNNLINRKKHKKNVSTFKLPQTQGLSYAGST